MTRSVAIVGGGLAAASVASTLRREGFDGTVVLIGDEPHLPYERPPLSKDLLQGRIDGDATAIYRADWYVDNDVHLRLGRRAHRLRPAERVVELSDGAAVHADAVVLATGGRPRMLPGAAGERTLYLRTRDDADRLAAHIRPGGSLVTVGLGFVGAEVAASARAAGMEVAAIERSAVPLENLLGTEVGAVCADLHRDHGVRLHTGEHVTSIVNTAAGIVVRTADGLAVAGDVVVLGVGMQPNTEVAEASGLVTRNGIVVDEYGRTSQPGVWAAGDVANHYHPVLGRHVRVEHYDHALRQGAAVARDILGRGQPYDDTHWFWSDVYSHSLQYAGHSARWDHIVTRGSVDQRHFVAFYLRDGVLQAAFGIGRPGEVRAVRGLIKRRIVPDTQRLSDTDLDLRTLAA